MEQIKLGNKSRCPIKSVLAIRKNSQEETPFVKDYAKYAA